MHSTCLIKINFIILSRNIFRISIRDLQFGISYKKTIILLPIVDFFSIFRSLHICYYISLHYMQVVDLCGDILELKHSLLCGSYKWSLHQSRAESWMPQPLSFSAPGRRLLFLFSRIFLFSRGNIHIDVENYPPSSGSVLFPFFSPFIFSYMYFFALISQQSCVRRG